MGVHASPAKAAAQPGAARAGPMLARPGHVSAVRRILRRAGVSGAVRVAPATDPAEAEAERVAAAVTAARPSAVVDATAAVGGSEVGRESATGRSPWGWAIGWSRGRGAGCRAGPDPLASRAGGPAPRIDAVPVMAEAVQRMAVPEPEPERPGEYLIQPRLEFGAFAPPDPPPDLDDRLARMRAGGAPLPAALRADMESRFGEDFSDVRIHRGPEAAALAGHLRARAFATGRDVAFAEGAFAPETGEGRRLIAHELTHVVQQRGSRRAAEASASAAAPTAAIQRQEDDEDLGFLASQAMRLVRRYAPRLEPIIRRGPVQWLRDQVGAAFDSLFATINALDLGAVVDQMAGW